MVDAKLWQEDGPLFEWWKEMHGLKGASLAALEPVEPKPGMRGQRAELKRAGSSGEAVCGAVAYHRLRWAAAQYGVSSYDEDRLVAVARVLAHVKDVAKADNGVVQHSFARLLASPKTEGRPVASELRFKRLLRIDSDREALTEALVRLLALANHQADPLTLAKSIWWWNENTRRTWANDYYQTLLDSNY